MVPTKFEARNLKIKDILFLNIDYQIRIPRYQRPYSWEEDQVSEFWNDIYTGQNTAFIGSFIFNKEFEETESVVDIIDGQQRVLTTTIFMAAIRNIAFKIKEVEYANLIHRQCIAFEDEEGDFKNRVLPGESTESFFVSNIQEPHKNLSEAQARTKEEKRIKKNYLYLENKIEQLLNTFQTKEDKINKLKELRQNISDLSVIEIEIYKEELAYEIFETVNARGVELSVSDLLKNLLFSKIKNADERDDAKSLWKQIEMNTEKTGSDLKKFLRYFWLSKESFVTEKKLYSAIKSKTIDYYRLVQNLESSSNWYNSIHTGDVNDFNSLQVKGKMVGAQVYRCIFATRLMNVTQVNTLYLSLLNNFERLELNPVNYLKQIEKFTFHYSAICKQPGNKVEKIYSKYAILIHKACQEEGSKARLKKQQSAFQHLLSELKAILPLKELFIEKFKEVTQYKRTESARKLIKYILEEIDVKAGTGEYKLDFNKVNIEHILPQKPQKWGLQQKDIKPYVNSIGNLTLLSGVINSSIGNDVIAKKLPELKKSEIQITKELCNQLTVDPVWDENKIKVREEALAQLAYNKIWKN